MPHPRNRAAREARYHGYFNYVYHLHNHPDQFKNIPAHWDRMKELPLTNSQLVHVLSCFGHAVWVCEGPSVAERLSAEHKQDLQAGKAHIAANIDDWIDAVATYHARRNANRALVVWAAGNYENEVFDHDQKISVMTAFQRLGIETQRLARLITTATSNAAPFPQAQNG